MPPEADGQVRKELRRYEAVPEAAAEASHQVDLSTETM